MGDDVTVLWGLSKATRLQPVLAPSLISLMVSVDVKHRVYLLTSAEFVSRCGLAVS